MVEVEVPLIPALEGERRHQVAVIRQAAHGLPGQSGDIAAERAHHGVWRRLTQVQDLSEALAAKTMAALEHLRPATPQVVGTVADLTLQLLCAQYVQMATTTSTIVRALQINHHLYPELYPESRSTQKTNRQLRSRLSTEGHGKFPIDGDGDNGPLH